MNYEGWREVTQNHLREGPKGRNVTLHENCLFFQFVPATELIQSFDYLFLLFDFVLYQGIGLIKKDLWKLFGLLQYRKLVGPLNFEVVVEG